MDIHYQKILNGNELAEYNAYLKSNDISEIIGTVPLNEMKDTLESSHQEKILMTVRFIDATIQCIQHHFEPYFIQLLPNLINLFSSKARNVQESSLKMCNQFCSQVNPYGTETVLNHLLKGGMSSENWKVKHSSCVLLNTLKERAPSQISRLLPVIVPALSHLMFDTHSEVKKTSTESLLNCCSLIENPDVKDLIPSLVEAHGDPKKTTFVIDKLMGTTFVHQVEITTLSVITPLLIRALRSRDQGLQRKACVVIINMSQLVNDKQDVAPFLPKILPLLNKIENEASFPEIRAIAADAKKKLSKT